jgi:hypothetical protein
MLRLLQIPQEALPHLHAFEAPATNLRKIISARAPRLDGRSVDLTQNMLDDEIAAMRRVATVDAHGALASFEIPLRELAEIAKLELDRARMQRILTDSPLKHALEYFASSADGVDRAFAAIEWLQAVKAVPMPQTIETAALDLMDAEADTIISEYTGLTEAANSLTAKLIGLRAYLAEQGRKLTDRGDHEAGRRYFNRASTLAAVKLLESGATAPQIEAAMQSWSQRAVFGFSSVAA